MARVEVLLATYQGAGPIGQLLDSLAAQTLPVWRLRTRDDGSSDGTQDKITSHPQLGDRVYVLDQPKGQLGATHNFLALLRGAGTEADYYAFCDQDDVWHPDKIERAAEALSGIEGHRPALYCGRQRLVDDTGREMGLSPDFSGTYKFTTAISQNIATGCTVVLNKPARDLLVQADDTNVQYHDWWAYLLVMGAGGAAIYDAQPHIDYRQHSANAVGSNFGFGLLIERIRRVSALDFHRTVARNTTALADNLDLLTPENRRLVQVFMSARKSFAGRLAFLRRYSLRRQNFWQTAVFYALFLFLGL
jgi:glycosyltransferase involved in cell wall biosynthesis